MNIISKIFSEVLSDWALVETDIEADFAKVKGALPASAQPDIEAMKSELKQAASNALGALETSALVYAPAATKAVENAADGALAALTGGLSVPLNPLLNSGIEQIEGHLVAAIRGWSLKAKASAVGDTTTMRVVTGTAELSAPNLVREVVSPAKSDGASPFPVQQA